MTVSSRPLCGGITLGMFALVVATGCSSNSSAPPVAPAVDTVPTVSGDPITPSQLAQSRKNLIQLANAANDFQDTYFNCPNNVTAKDGKALLSWRVRLLPFLGEKALYEEFKLDEPWDSEHNKKLIEKMPKVFAPVRGKANPGETFYLAFVGPGTVWEPGKSYNFATVTDGTSNTVFCVEAGSPVIWTKPEDLPFDPKGDLPKLGGLFDGDFHIQFLDGSCELAKKDFNPAAMKSAITCNGGEIYDRDSLLKNPPKPDTNPPPFSPRSIDRTPPSPQAVIPGPSTAKFKTVGSASFNSRPPGSKFSTPAPSNK